MTGHEGCRDRDMALYLIGWVAVQHHWILDESVLYLFTKLSNFTGYWTVCYRYIASFPGSTDVRKKLVNRAWERGYMYIGNTTLWYCECAIRNGDEVAIGLAARGLKLG